jgi:NAD(P)-dependent dehydrogenase (short-subunit alcohol dehydrogenase family)
VAALNALPNKQPGAKAYSVPADSSKVSEIERLVKEVEKHTDHVDILFANAGATWGSYIDKVDEKNGWDKVMDLNVKGVFFTIQKYVAVSKCPQTISIASKRSNKFADSRLFSKMPVPYKTPPA